MRILAIRGRNLASLAGDFEMRLDAPPLADAGLFAITGRTGSGKSTTLDALCLALFDRMPRLPGGRGVEVGRADEALEYRLKNNDVRSVLRRGTGEGYAEVDFRGVDGRRYRARWSVRRARQRADGRFQAQTMELRDLDSGVDLSGNKMEVLDAIQQRLGLTFDQFRRSVLLAQGDFAAFLRAGAGERAELLERITGTGIYGEISKAAFFRAKEAKQQLELVRQRLGDQRPLVEEEREALENELAAARHARDVQFQAERALEQAQRWYQTLDKLVAERDQTGAQLARAQADQSAAEPRRRDFERIRALQSLRLPLTAFDQANEEQAGSRQGLEVSITEEGARRSDAERATAAAAADEAAYATADEIARKVVPSLQAARRLDTRIQDAREQMGRATADCRAGQRLFKEIRGEQDGLQKLAEKAVESLAQAEHWLTDRASIAPLAAQWDAWTRELERYARARDSSAKANADIEAADRSVADLAGRRGSLEARNTEIDVDRKRILAERADLESRVATVDLDRLAALREQGQERRDKVGHWRQLAAQAAETLARLEATGAALAAEKARRVRSDTRLQGVEGEIRPLAATLAEAEEVYRRLLLASAGEVETLRARLQVGQPCPVCGAEQHPWAHGAESVIEDLAKEQADRVGIFERRLGVLTVEKARRLAEMEQADRRGTELATELATYQALSNRTLASWSVCELEDLRPVDPFAEGLAERQASELQVIAGKLEKIAEDEATARALLAQIKTRTIGIDSLDVSLGESRKQLVELDGQARIRTEARNRAEIERAGAEKTIKQVLMLLAEPLAGIDDWRKRLREDPETFIVDCREVVVVWGQRVAQRDDACQTGHDLAPRLAQAKARLQGASEELARRTMAEEKLSGVLSALVRDRAALLDGRPADAVEVELNAGVAAAQKRREQSRSNLAKAREALTAAQGVAAIRRQAVSEKEAGVDEARQALNDQMAGQGVTLEQLRAALVRDQDWVDAERLVFQALQVACDRSQALFKERRRRVEEHGATERPKLDPETVAERLPHAAETLKVAQEHWGRLHGRLGEDDRRRDASREIQAALDQQQQSWELWESLRELIGSADGSKFRNFAQGLTLDLLVAHANHHLRDLARRYELQRVPGAEMEIQVIDREMGDEVRSIHSLSGGESFLASLALALGLASLASDRVEVESLFIDEGFGALDADSLDLAIASLDALYSLGRQVGVISHVGTLVERIGVKVQVTKQGGGRSRLDVVTD